MVDCWRCDEAIPIGEEHIREVEVGGYSRPVGFCEGCAVEYDDEAEAEPDGPRLDATTILSEEEEREIVYRRVFLVESQKDVAEHYGVSTGTIYNIMQAYREHGGEELELEILDECDDLEELIHV